MPSDRSGQTGDDATQPMVGPGSQLGPYRIDAELGQGGMGQVFRASDSRLGREVAVKVSRVAFSDRFEREARTAAALNHPHVCTLYDVGPNYLVMELVEGQTLEERLRDGRLSVKQALEYGAQIAGALAAAHDKGIVHRDLKPANIMLTRTGVKVLDFGLAKSVVDDTLTAANVVMGTPAYMPPEQRAGRPCDARTDIYALGLVIYEMATGVRAPVDGSLPPDALPEKLGHAVSRCLAPDPDERWQSARDLKAELEWAAKDGGSRASAVTASTPRRTWAIPAAVLGAAASAALGVLAGTYWQQPAVESRVVVSSVLPPAKTTFDFAENNGPVALSPDGTRMVFATTGEDGESRLWLRALDAVEAQPLPGTDRGAFPFWSPDSRWVAFFADGYLKKIDTRGGASVPLAVTTGGGIGGSWSAKGQIVFAANAFSPMLKVSQDGGDTAVAVETDVSGNAYPWFLPDGEHFLFASWVGAGRATLRVGSLASTASEVIGETDSNAIYADGHLLYLRGDSLVAQAFDLQSLRAEGEPVPLAARVGRFGGLVNAGVFSASQTGLLAYQTGGDAALSQLTWFDRKGQATGTLGDPRAYFNVEFSPDGRTLMASAPDAVGNFDLWSYDLARGAPQRFTTDPAGEYYGVWSADGRTVIFNSTRKGHYDLYRKSASGAGPEELVYADATDKVPSSWSRDGRSLVYFTGGGSQFRLWLLRLTPDQPGAPLTPVPLLGTTFNERSASLSPDDRWVAYVTDESGRNQVYVAPFARPTEKHQISTDGGDSPRWRRDGSGIFYQGPGGQLREAVLRIAADRVEVTSVTPVFGRAASLGGRPYDVSADEQRALIARPEKRQIEPITLMENWPAALKH